MSRRRLPAALVAAVLLPGALLAAPTPVAAQRADRFEPVRERIRQAIAEDGVPSVAVAVAHRGRIVWEEGFGWADRERRIEATPHTPYSLASISKPITATALMVLVERGEVALDRPVNDYLGPGRVRGLPAVAGPFDAAGATVRRVASHTAGLPLHYQFFYDGAGYGRPAMDETIARYANLVVAPGEQYVYSNLGYGILDHLIARVAGRSYADFLREEVFVPLGLTRTSVALTPELAPFAAARYDERQRPIPFYDFDHPGASAVWASAHDLARFGMFHLGEGVAGQRAILSAASRAAMQRRETPGDGAAGYGLGWQVNDDLHGHRVVSHTGGMPGVATNLMLFPDERLVIAVVTNTRHGIPFQAGEEIAALLLPRFAATRAERRAAAAARPAPVAGAPDVAPFAGSWVGTLRTYEDTLPVALVFQPDGDVHVRLADQPPALLSVLAARPDGLSGWFPGRIPTEEQGRHPHRVLLQLRLLQGDDGRATSPAPRLAGQATAQTMEEPIHYALTSYLELRRVAELPLDAAEATRLAGTYDVEGAAGAFRVSVLPDGRLRLEGRGSTRTLLRQEDGSFVAAEEPTLRLRIEGDRLRATNLGRVVEAARRD
jgi:CubicO group peptidase (beta-lactamase class C family)